MYHQEKIIRTYIVFWLPLLNRVPVKRIQWLCFQDRPLVLRALRPANGNAREILEGGATFFVLSVSSSVRTKFLWFTFCSEWQTCQGAAVQHPQIS
jgi:hypothetical protein